MSEQEIRDFFAELQKWKAANPWYGEAAEIVDKYNEIKLVYDTINSHYIDAEQLAALREHNQRNGQ